MKIFLKVFVVISLIQSVKGSTDSRNTKLMAYVANLIQNINTEDFTSINDVAVISFKAD